MSPFQAPPDLGEHTLFGRFGAWAISGLGAMVLFAARILEKRADKQDAETEARFVEIEKALAKKADAVQLSLTDGDVRALKQTFADLRVEIAELHGEVLNTISTSREEIVAVMTENQRQSDKAMAAQTLEFTKALNVVANSRGSHAGG